MGIASRLGKYSIISQGGRNPFARTGGEAQKILSPYLRGQPKRTAFYKSDSAPNSCSASSLHPSYALVDAEGSCGEGDFVWRPGGNIHVAHAPRGATFLSVFNRPNRFFDGTKFFTSAEERG